MIIVSKSVHGTPRKRLREVNYGKALESCQRCDCIRRSQAKPSRLTLALHRVAEVTAVSFFSLNDK
jgi:hypothetical protein